jgi:hypothetical protein
MIKRSSFALPALHVRRESSSQTLGLILPSYLMMLPGAQKCLEKWASSWLLQTPSGQALQD